MNQGKLEVVKQEIARVIVDILEISELKWTGMGEFHSNDHYIYYCGQESLRRPLELTSKKDVLFIIGDWNAKVGLEWVNLTQMNIISTTTGRNPSKTF